MPFFCFVCYVGFGKMMVVALSLRKGLGYSISLDLSDNRYFIGRELCYYKICQKTAEYRSSFTEF